MQADAIGNLTKSTRHSGRPECWRKSLGAFLVVTWLASGLVACRTSNSGRGGSAPDPPGTYAKLGLNHGKKWVVVEPMMVHLRNLEKEVADFEAMPSRDHAALAVDIQENLGRLVTKCTMEGKAHDELHKWLMPFLRLERIK